jgi:hypothetical protein
VAVERVGRRLRTPRAAGLAGIAFAALFVSAFLLLRSHPGPGSTPAEIADWYLRKDTGNIALVGLYLVPFSGIAFLWFIAALRDLIGAWEDQFFSTVFFGSGVLFVALVFASAASAGALLAAIKYQGAPVPGADVVVLARALGYALLYVYATRAAAVFVIVTSTIGLRVGVLPRWLAIGGYLIALVLLFVVDYVEPIVLLIPAWVVLVSVAILMAQRTNRLQAGSR